MKNFITRANSSLTVGRAAWILSGSFALSAVLGLLREKLLLANFKLGPTLDAYIIAFSIPDFMFYILVSGALSVTFIPVLSQRVGTGNKESAWRLSSSLINFLALTTLVASLLIFAFAGPLVNIVARGSSEEVKATATGLMRIIAVNPFLFSISSVLASMQQTFSRFFFNSIAPVIYNLGIIFGIVVIAPWLGSPGKPAILGVALGVGLGAIVQLLVQLIGMVGIGFKYQPEIFWKNKGFRKVLRLLPSRSLDQGIDYLNSIVERFIASFLFAGAITAYNTAFILRNVPITLIGVAISTAAFPSISARAASKRSDLFRKDLMTMLSIILWLALPAAIIAFLTRGYLVRFILGSGNEVIVAILGWFVGSIVFRALFHAITRAFYAQQDTYTPLKISIASILLNVTLAFVFVDMFGIVGLAMAQTAVAVFEVSILMFIMSGRVGSLVGRHNLGAIIKMMVAAGVMATVNYGIVRYVLPLKATDVGFFTLMPKFFVIVFISLLTYGVVSYLLKIEEVKPLAVTIRRLLFKPLKLQ